MSDSGGYIRGKPDVSWWITQIHKGIAYRKKDAYQSAWADWRRYYRGDWNAGVLPVNLFFKMARTIIPRVYFRNPSVSVTPTQPGMLNWVFAQLLERTDNKMINNMRMKVKMKRIVSNSWFFGVGIMKIGYGGQYNYNVSDHGNEQPILRGGRRVETNSDITSFMPWVDSVHPGNFIVPDKLINYEETPWVAQWIRRDVNDVKNDPRLKNTADITRAKSTTRNHSKDLSNEFRTADEGNDIDLIEIHDMRRGKVIVIAPFVTNRVLYFGDDDLQAFGSPNYKPLIFNENDDSFWGVPDAKILEPDQIEINEVRTLMMYHWRLGVAKLLYKANAIEPREIQKIIDGEVMGAIKVNGDLRTSIQVMEAGGVPDSLLKADQQINQDVRESMGFSRNEFGDVSPPNARTSATESVIAKQSSDIRIDERRDMAADVLVDTIDHVNHVIFNHWNEEQVVDVVGPMGVPIWVKFRPSMLKKGSYIIKSDPDTAMPESREARQQRAVQTYSLLRDNPLIDPIRLTRNLLNELHGVQFDDMMRGMPPGLGGPTQPLELQEYIQLTTEIANRAPSALPAPGAQVINSELSGNAGDV